MCIVHNALLEVAQHFDAFDAAVTHRRIIPRALCQTPSTMALQPRLFLIQILNTRPYMLHESVFVVRTRAATNGLPATIFEKS